MDAIFERMSIRKYEDRPVEQEKIEKLLRAAMAAPSAVNQQPWEFYVVKNRETIVELSKASPFAACAAGAPVVIVPILRKDAKHPELANYDLANATENILLELLRNARDAHASQDAFFLYQQARRAFSFFGDAAKGGVVAVANVFAKGEVDELVVELFYGVHGMFRFFLLQRYKICEEIPNFTAKNILRTNEDSLNCRWKDGR